MRNCFAVWSEVLYKGGHCILVLDNSYCTKFGMPLTEALIKIAVEEVGGFKHLGSFEDPIPNERRVRPYHNGSKVEIIVVLRKY